MYQYEVINFSSDEFVKELNEYCKKGFKLFQIMGQKQDTNEMVCLMETFVADAGEEDNKKEPMQCT